VIDLLMKCLDCGKDAKVKCGQVARKDNLYWYRSWDCSSCGFRLEEDGDDIPEELRKLLLEKDGYWALVIGETEKNAEAFKVIRNIVGLSIKDIAKLKKEFVGKVYVGTQTEAEYYFRRCRENGLELSIEKV
jgi:DNA-directed RNA polymerase subunit RPC12/RpoP